MEISLALGGGGSRGFAHIGVLQYLHKMGIKVSAIAGTSAGGMVACFYAAGYSPSELEEISLSIDQKKLYSIISSSGPGLLGLSNPMKLFEEYLGERQFSDLKIPCAVIAVDIKSNREIIINTGRVVDAILATIAVPGIFPPKFINGYELVDGGVLNPVPVSVARKLAPKLPIVAVVLSSPLEKPGRITHIPLSLKVPTPILDKISQTRIAQAISIFLHSIDIGQRVITELKLTIDKPDVVIRPEVEGIGLLDPVDISSVVRLGYVATKSEKNKLARLVSWRKRIQRQIFSRRQ